MQYFRLNKIMFWTLVTILGLFACKSTSNKQNPLLDLKTGLWKPILVNQQVPFFLQDVENSTSIPAPIWIVDNNPKELQHYDAVIGKNAVQQNSKGEWVVHYNNPKNSWVLTKDVSGDTLYCTYLDPSGATEQVVYTHLEDHIPTDLEKDGAIKEMMLKHFWVTSKTSTDVTFTKFLDNATNSDQLSFARLIVKKEQDLFTEDKLEPISLQKYAGYNFMTLSEGVFYLQALNNEKGRIKLMPLRTPTVTDPIYWTKLDSVSVHLDSLVKLYEEIGSNTPN